MKKYLFLGGVAAVVLAGLAGGWPAALGALALLLAWLASETEQRLQPRFFDRSLRERQLRFASEPHAVMCSAFDPSVLFIEGHRRFTLADHGSGSKLGSFELSAPRAAALGPGQVVAVAEDEALLLYDASGRVLARQAFEAPLQRQGYQLQHSADGKSLALHCPWFVEVFPADLSGPGIRLRFEEAGHYLKYCALSPDGSRLMTAGALLLDDEQGLEARWDVWQREQGGWKALQKESRESQANSHLRGVGFSGQGGWAWAELYHEGYEFILYDAAGALHWRRAGGERPVFGLDGRWLLFESAIQGLALAQVAEKAQAWARPLDAPLRFKAVDARGQSLLLEGGSFVLLKADGSELWREPMRLRDDAFSAGPDGRFAFLAQDRASLLRLPWISAS